MSRKTSTTTVSRGGKSTRGRGRKAAVSNSPSTTVDGPDFDAVLPASITPAPASTNLTTTMSTNSAPRSRGSMRGRGSRRGRGGAASTPPISVNNLASAPTVSVAPTSTATTPVLGDSPPPLTIDPALLSASTILTPAASASTALASTALASTTSASTTSASTASASTASASTTPASTTSASTASTSTTSASTASASTTSASTASASTTLASTASASTASASTVLASTTSTSTTLASTASTFPTSTSTASASTAPNNGGQPDVSTLLTIIAAQQAQLNHAAASAQARESILKPADIGNLQEAMRLDGFKRLYNSCRAAVRTACSQVNVSPEVYWYDQDIELLGKVAARAKQIQPRLGIYAHSWATFEIMKTFNKNRRTYRNRSESEEPTAPITPGGYNIDTERLTGDDTQAATRSWEDENVDGNNGNSVDEGEGTTAGDGGNVAVGNGGNSAGKRRMTYSNRGNKRRRAH